jgi:hypothetical protein
MCNKGLLIIGFMLIFHMTAMGQISQEEKIREQQMAAEAARNTMISRMIDEGVDQMNRQEYEAANNTFRDVLDKARVVPTDLTFYFGKNSFYLGKYQQSIDWLTKYMELKGTQGQYYEECLSFLEKSKEAFRLVRKEEQESAKVILSSNYEIDCGPSGKVVCPICKGRTVIIRKGPLGNTYQECPYSDSRGNLTCEQYNKLLRGELVQE